jgi:DNA/RNA-binding domain of Phe-tRNA-synthetase-like protein
MSLEVSAACQELGLRAGAVCFHGVRIGPAPPELRQEIAQEVVAIRAKFGSVEAVRARPEVAAFAGILRRVGVNPRRLRPSVERLLTGAVQRGELPAINNLVDAYNLVSVRTLCSLGAHDRGLLAEPVTLRPLTGRETFTPLGQADPVPVPAGEFGYVDAGGRLLCRLDVLQADRTKVTPATTDVLLIIEATTAHSPLAWPRALGGVLDLIPRVCGGTAEVVAWPDGGPGDNSDPDL